ncbi:MAG: type II secretion system protein [bacterium]
MKKQKAFTLIELLVVIAIIGLLSSIAAVGLKGVKSKARDAVRLSDANTMMKALDLYYDKNENYPITGRGGLDWLSSYNDTKNWIPGLAPEFMTEVPDDKAPENCWPNSPEICYYYRSSGSVYCLQVSLENPSSAANAVRIFGPETGGIYKLRYGDFNWCDASF